MNQTITGGIRNYVKRTKAESFLRSDFDRFGGYDQVGRALRALIKEGVLVRIGYGCYAKARLSSITKRPVPKRDLFLLAFDLYKRLGANPEPSRAMREQLDGSTQIPMREALKIRSKVTRRFKYNQREIGIER
jgi:hypothetical protein